MKLTSCTIGLLIFGASLSIGLASATASTLGPVWPAPGGTSYGTTGNLGRSGGLTATYTGFNFSSFDQLWWGPQGVEAGGDNNLSALSLVSMSGNTATWQGTTTFNTDTASYNVGTRFVATIQSGSSGWIDPTSVAITPGPEAVAEITSGPFTVNEAFSVYDLGTLADIAPFLDYYDTHHRSNASGTGQMSLNGEMYYTPAITPLPAALPLFAFGLGGLGLLGWRRKKRKNAVTQYA